jgi:hypothetical protein
MSIEDLKPPGWLKQFYQKRKIVRLCILFNQVKEIWNDLNALNERILETFKEINKLENFEEIDSLIEKYSKVSYQSWIPDADCLVNHLIRLNEDFVVRNELFIDLEST